MEFIVTQSILAVGENRLYLSVLIAKIFEIPIDRGTHKKLE